MDLQKIVDIISSSNHLVVLTGAGISVESGVPSYRGKDGLWVRGSKHYHPMDLATYRTLRKDPETAWEFYNYRRKYYRSAEPNVGHYAIVKLEHWFKKQKKSFHLVTQNVDALHLRAGSDPNLTYEIHGNALLMRCISDCQGELYEIPLDATNAPFCPNCREIMRPNVLLFDETYNERYYKAETVLSLTRKMDCLLIIGTSLQTNLPSQIVMVGLQRGIPLIEINPEPIQSFSRTEVIQLPFKSGDILPKIVNELDNKDKHANIPT